MAWSKNGTTTLSSAGDDIDITSLTASDFNGLLMHFWGEIDLVTPDMTLDNTGGNDYARRNSSNGGTDTTLTSQAFVENGLGGIPTNAWSFVIDYIINIDSEEKLGIGFCIAGSEGVTNAPSRSEFVWKKDTSTDTGQFTRIDINNTDAGNFATGSNLTVLNGDTTEVAILGNNVQSGSRFEATDTRKIYYGALPSVTFEDDFSTDKGWVVNDSNKINVDYTTNNRIDYDINRDNTNDKAYIDLGSTVSDTAWVLRFHNYLTTFSGTINIQMMVGLSDNTASSAVTSQDVIYMNLNLQDNKYYFHSVDNAIISASSTSDLGVTPTNSQEFWFEMIRTSATTATLTAYSDSTYSTVAYTTNYSIASTTDNLRYIFVDHRQSTEADGGTLVGYIDDIQFYDGVTSTDFTWTEEA